MSTRVAASIGLGLAALGMTVAGGMPAAAGGSPVPKVSVSITGVRGTVGECVIKWSASNLVPGQIYAVGVYKDSTLLFWTAATAANSRGSIRTDDVRGGYPLDKSYALSGSLVTNGVDVVATDDSVSSRCTAP